MLSDAPRSLKRKVSPPPTRKVSRRRIDAEAKPEPAAVEAGQADVNDHLTYWTSELAKAVKSAESPSLSLNDFAMLYKRNQHARGHHFVVHQHDHPVAGVHYDLRLQFSETSSLSFSIPYGLPGNANSVRPNRMAIETRVHNVWNNLIESASHATGSLLIWDTGEYEVLPRPIRRKARETDDEEFSDPEEVEKAAEASPSQPQKLHAAFHDRHLHLRLHGTRLPPGYTIAMRLPKQNVRQHQPRKTKRRVHRGSRIKKPAAPQDTESDTPNDTATPAGSTVEEAADETAAAKGAAVASDDEADDAAERDKIRETNAYPGATNSIGSIHQRQWFLSLDRENSGFVKARTGPDKGRWMRGENTDGSRSGFETFFVMGREVERSIVTGRMAMDIMDDAGVKAYEGRKMWRPITQ